MELPTNLSGIVSFLDREVPHFSCHGHGYTVTPGKGTLGKRWNLTIESINYANRELPPIPIGRVELETLDDNLVQLRIPPRMEQNTPEAEEYDRDGQILGSFIFQTLNTLHRHKLINLPGVLPTV